MSGALGLISDVVRFSHVDGPGSRFVVFFQGCNFDCLYCHNPSTINTCIDCGICVEPCPRGALSYDENGGVLVDWDRCDGCDGCTAMCPFDSTPLARWVTVDALFEEIRAAAPYLSGVTASGGEATLQAEFVAELFSRIKRHPQTSGLTTLIDTNGSCDTETWDLLLPVMDGAMVDLKAFDADVHRSLTHIPNTQVLESIRHLAERDRLSEVRLPLIAGFNDSDEMLARTGHWLRDIDPDIRITLIGFRRQGVRPRHAGLAEPTYLQMEHYEHIVSGQGVREDIAV